MSLLFDQNISFRIVKLLSATFPECRHISECGLMNCEDMDIWKYAKTNNLVLVTFDSDFYDISLINGHPPKIIWIRKGNLPTHDIANLLISKKEIIDIFLSSDEFIDISCLEIG